MEILTYCKQIHDLLERVGETKWQEIFAQFITDLKQKEDHTIYRKIISHFGMSASFNDLVLSKDGTFLPKENEELDRLRLLLYHTIVEKWKA